MHHSGRVEPSTGYQPGQMQGHRTGTVYQYDVNQCLYTGTALGFAAVPYMVACLDHK